MHVFFFQLSLCNLLTSSLGTIKASQVVVLNEDSVVVTQQNSCKQHDSHLQNEFDFVEKQIH